MMKRQSQPETIDYAAMEDLLKVLRFAPKEGRIWLGDQRVVMMHLSTLSAMRRQLIDAHGIAATRTLLTHMGYISGTQDARIARRVRGAGSHLDMLLAGPLLYALEGVTLVNPITVDMNIEKGEFFVDLCWENSSEVDAHVSAYGISPDPVCWMQVGHASGYASEFVGRQVIFREVECQGMGARRCRVIGKTREQWGADGPALQFFQPEAVVSLPADPPRRSDPSALGELVGASSGFVSICHLLDRVAKTNATVLLSGETGVGKEMFAKTLHRISGRADKTFVAVNCAAIPDSLIESELFGVEKGAFTGAVASRPGRFERADGGTLFLDEVGILNLPAQGKLLRALQEREIERVGDTRVRKVNVRLVAATNEDLDAAVKAGRFREDLYYRLNVFPIHIPPLRERRDDISPLMEHFITKFAVSHGRKVAGFTERAIDALLSYSYPGNIRELENMIERALILSDDNAAIDLIHLFGHAPAFLSEFMQMGGDGLVGGRKSVDARMDPVAERIVEDGLDLKAVETMVIRKAVAKCGGNLTRAGRLLGLSRTQVAYRLGKG